MPQRSTELRTSERGAASSSPARPRRTQAERRAATRSALLDAAVACLVEDGYANLTTRNVAERAGVSQATQMHYFPTRAQFVAEAVRHVAIRLSGEVREETRSRTRSERRRLEELLDQAWEVHKGPAFQAAMELWVAARTDPEIRRALDEVSTDIARLTAELAAELFPEMMDKRGARELLATGSATMRGLALLRFAGQDAVADRAWRSARRQLLDLWLALGNGAA